MDRWKAEQGRGREKRKIRREKSRRERVRRKKMQMREKVGKSRNTVFFQWFVAPEGRRVGSLQRRVRSQLARWEMKKCTPLWREAHFEVKMHKTHYSRTTFGSWDVEKVHAIVARSTFRSQNAENTPFSDHFWKLRCRKSARRCGAKHISKSKCTKHTILGPLLEVAMSKKCSPLWREADFEVKMYKTHQVRTTFGSWDVEKVHAVVARSTFRSQNAKNKHQGFGPLLEVQMSKKCTPVARSTFPSQNVKNSRGSDHFWRFRCRFAWQAQGIVHLVKCEQTWGLCGIFNYNHHYTTLHSNTLHSITFNYAQLHYITLHCTPLHYIPLHYTTFHYTTLHYTTLHYTTLPSTTLHYLPLHYITLHYTTLHYTTPSTTLHSTTLHYTTLHYTTLHYTTLHNTTTTTTQLHYTPLH